MKLFLSIHLIIIFISILTFSKASYWKGIKVSKDTKKAYTALEEYNKIYPNHPDDLRNVSSKQMKQRSRMKQKIENRKSNKAN